MEVTEAKNGKAKSEASIPKGPLTAPEILRAIAVTANCIGADATSLHWQCTLTYEGRSYSVAYRMGYAHTTLDPKAAQSGDVANPALREIWALQGVPYSGPIFGLAPKAAELLAHVQTVASVPKSFAKWCEATGANPDSRAAAKAHDALKAGKKAVATWLGEEAFTVIVGAGK